MPRLTVLAVAVLPLLAAGCRMPVEAARSRVLTPAESNCLAAVAEATEQGDVAIVSTSASETGSIVVAEITGEGTRFSCAADPDGQVVSVAPAA